MRKPASRNESRRAHGSAAYSSSSAAPRKKASSSSPRAVGPVVRGRVPTVAHGAREQTEALRDGPAPQRGVAAKRLRGGLLDERHPQLPAPRPRVRGAPSSATGSASSTTTSRHAPCTQAGSGAPRGPRARRGAAVQDAPAHDAPAHDAGVPATFEIRPARARGGDARGAGPPRPRRRTPAGARGGGRGRRARRGASSRRARPARCPPAPDRPGTRASRPRGRSGSVLPAAQFRPPKRVGPPPAARPTRVRASAAVVEAGFAVRVAGGRGGKSGSTNAVPRSACAGGLCPIARRPRDPRQPRARPRRRRGGSRPRDDSRSGDARCPSAADGAEGGGNWANACERLVVVTSGVGSARKVRRLSSGTGSAEAASARANDASPSGRFCRASRR